MTVESKTSDAVLQLPTEVKIGKKKYKVAKPTAATLILISKYIAELPVVDVNKDIRTLDYALSIACQDNSADILAILIRGAKKPIYNKGIFGAINRIAQKKLSEKILYNMDHEDIVVNTMSILSNIKTAFFLSNLIFLKEINLLRKTRI